MRKLYNGYTEERWEKILNDPYLKVSLDATVAKADKYISEPIEVIKYSSLHLFETTGNRTEFERPYNLLNNRVDMLFLGYLITKNDKYIKPLIDSIWELCNLESWSLSAHVSEGKSLAERRGWLELCSSNVGRRLGEIVTLIGDKFPELVIRRIKHEIRERVVESFKKYKFWWNETHNNWASVCIAGVLGAYLYVATDEEIEEQLPRMCEIADNFLLGYDDEGCCGEGYEPGM